MDRVHARKGERVTSPHHENGICARPCWKTIEAPLVQAGKSKAEEVQEYGDTVHGTPYMLSKLAQDHFALCHSVNSAGRAGPPGALAGATRKATTTIYCFREPIHSSLTTA